MGNSAEPKRFPARKLPSNSTPGGNHPAARASYFHASYFKVFMNDPENESEQFPTPASELPPQQQTVEPMAAVLPPEPPETRFLKMILFGPNGLRTGCSAATFVALAAVFVVLAGTITAAIGSGLFHLKPGHITAASAALSEFSSLLGLLAAGAIVAAIESRTIARYYLSGPGNLPHFLGGILGGFLALSLLVGVLYSGGHLSFGRGTLGPTQILHFGLLWALMFLFTALFEEGAFRCFLLNILARGMNYWWAAGSVAFLCLFALLNSSSNGGAGVYTMALLGCLPCLLVHLKKLPDSGFWQAAWFTSTAFGYVHTFNDGESRIGILSAASIGFVFCVSIRLTGSAWWAIGFHGAWDWAQTFFYGTPDSGLPAQGHYLTTTPIGAAFWSGGSDGPEGSVLVLPIVILILLALLVLYRRRPGLESPSPAAQAQLS